MKKTAAALAVIAALGFPALAEAREITFTTKLKPYGGSAAYIALYVTDGNGQYQGTLWVAGGQAKYYRHLSDWKRATRGDLREIDGITGASVGSGKTLTVTVDLADVLIDAGYQVRVDAAVEDMGDSPGEIVVPLNSNAAGQPVAGSAYVESFSYSM
ncbi:DUF2271 domain-containing protein [Dongia sp.]|uniref:DUF2271 domain-containing protein n=1 Tax=Dongia sp. TaxID=1977262 RepID=UPI0035AD9647